MPPQVVATSRRAQVLATGEATLWLLLVGVNHYSDESLPSLRCCAADCQGVADALLVATSPFPSRRLLIHHDYAPDLPLYKAVDASLERIVTEARPQDTVLLYFCGHGALSDDAQAVLCLADTRRAALTATGLPLERLLLRLGECAARQQLVWLDACHSGGLGLKELNGALNAPADPTVQFVEVLRERAAKRRGFYALLACDSAQRSWEFPDLGHGVFSYYLMCGLRGEAANAQGVIEIDGLYQYVYYRTLRYIDNLNQQLRLLNRKKLKDGDPNLYTEYPLQTPKRIVEGVGELVVGFKAVGTTEVYRRQALVVAGLAEGQTTLQMSKLLRGAGAFELEYWPQPGEPWTGAKEAIERLLVGDGRAMETTLLYLSGRLEHTEDGETLLVLGDSVRIGLLWLRQQLRASKSTQRVVILDCPGATRLDEWTELLQLGVGNGQCLIAAASPAAEPKRFAEAVISTLESADPKSGLSVANWIGRLQEALAGSDTTLQAELSGVTGVIDLLPGSTQQGERGRTLALKLCPYMGLRAFTERDAPYFYGRTDLTQELVERLRRQAFLCVVGASGSGKSSVVQAGLLAQLRQGQQLPGSERWWLGSFRPGSEPLEALSRALSESVPREREKQQIEGLLHLGVEGFVRWLRTRPEPMVVLVVDQFEEVLTLASVAEREALFALLFGALERAADRFKLVVTLRADFIGACLEVPVLAGLIKRGSVLVPSRLSTDDYRQVIVGPAQKVGLNIEAELVEVLLQELDGSTGDLPLLEFVLEQLWARRTADGKLTLQSYQQEVGGLKGALESRAEAAYLSLDAEGQACTRWIFLALTQLGEGVEDTRRRVRKADLVVPKYPLALVERTLQVLVAAKLVVVNLEEDERVAQSRGASQGPRSDSLVERLEGQVTVEVAHEILIRHWSTLRWWLEQNRSRLRLRRQIELAALLWKQNDRQPDFLLSGVRLAEAEEIYTGYTAELSNDVLLFLEACLEQRKQQQQLQKRRLRWTQATAVIMAVLGVGASGLGWLAYLQMQAAQRSEIKALNSQSQAHLISNQQLEALVASVKAQKLLYRTLGGEESLREQTDDTLKQVITVIREKNRLEGHSGWVRGVTFSPDGNTIVTASRDIRFWSPDGTLLKILNGHSDWVYSTSFSPDGKLLASGSRDRSIKIWDVHSGTVLRTLQSGNVAVSSVGFSPDGRLLVSASRDNKIRFWNAADGRLLRTLEGHADRVRSAAFSPDGRLLVSSSHDKTVKIWNVSDGRLLRTLEGHTDWVGSAAFSPNSRLVASSSRDKTVRIWNAADGRLLRTLEGNTDDVLSAVFAPDGNTIASAGYDKTVRVWSIDGTPLKVLSGHSAEVNAVSFSPDSKTLASASDDRTVRLWKLDSDLIETVVGSGSRVSSVSFSPDRKTVAWAGADKTIRFWNLEKSTLLRTIPRAHQDQIWAISFSPDGKTLASAGDDKTVKIWSTVDGRLLHAFTGHESWVKSISFGPDGKTIASAGNDRTIKIWSIADGRLLHTLEGHSDSIYGVSFSHDGRTVASASQDGTVKLWRVADGTLLKTFSGRTGHAEVVYSVSFSPDDRTLASAGNDGTIKIWSTANGRLLHTLEGHSDSIYSVSFSYDGRTIASASQDKTVKLWDVDRGTLVSTFRSHSSWVRSVSFSPDGQSIASASTGEVLVWNWQLQLSNLSERGCSWLKNYLRTNPNLDKDEQHLCDEK